IAEHHAKALLVLGCEPRTQDGDRVGVDVDGLDREVGGIGPLGGRCEKSESGTDDARDREPADCVHCSSSPGDWSGDTTPQTKRAPNGALSIPPQTVAYAAT